MTTDILDIRISQAVTKKWNSFTLEEKKLKLKHLDKWVKTGNIELLRHFDVNIKEIQQNIKKFNESFKSLA